MKKEDKMIQDDFIKSCFRREKKQTAWEVFNVFVIAFAFGSAVYFTAHIILWLIGG